MGTFPIYRKGKESGIVIKFMDLKEGYVLKQGTSSYQVGSFHSDWNPYTHECWEPYDYESNPILIKEITPENMELFTTIRLEGISSSTLTKVPNGYVMTSSSGHQVFIKDSQRDFL